MIIIPKIRKFYELGRFGGAKYSVSIYDYPDAHERFKAQYDRLKDYSVESAMNALIEAKARIPLEAALSGKPDKC